MDTVPPLKTCRVCGEAKPLDQFPQYSTAPARYRRKCKTCESQHNREYYQRNWDALAARRNSESEKARRKAYEQANSEHRAEMLRLWRSRNREQYRETDRRWRAEHPESVAATNRKQYEANAKAYNERSRQWRKKNPDRHREHFQAWRARQYGANENFTQVEFRELCEAVGNSCLACGCSGPLVADHVIPLARGGANSIGNIQPLCRSCNAKKHTKTIDYRPLG